MDGGCDGVEKGKTVGGTTRIDNAEVEKNILYHDYEYANNQNALRELLGAAIGSDSDDTTYQPIDSEADEDSALDIRFDDSEDEITKNEKFPEHVDNHTQLLDEFADVDEEYQSEELNSDYDSDEEEPRKRFPMFEMPHSMDDYEWIVGTTFTDKAQLKMAVDTYCIHSGRNMRWTHSDPVRAIKKCKVAGCKFYLSARVNKEKGTWQLKRVGPRHNCSRVFQTGKPKKEWLANKFKDNVRRNPGFKVSKMILTMREDHGCGFSRVTAQRAKILAKQLAERDSAKTYLRIYDFAAEIERSNQGSHTVIKTMWPDGWEENRLLPDPKRLIFPKFRRFYICLKAARDSFVSSCRPIISLDGCFLKTQYKGQLVTAVGRDANDQMLPIAFVVVESENKDLWCWFLTLLTREIGDYIQYTFISDQQKGLVPAFDLIMPGVDHRFCVRHLYNNFRKKFGATALKMLMWRAATSTYVQEFERAMEEIKKHNNQAFDYLMKLERRYWSKCAFSSIPKCDAVLNNMSETFNSCILDQREMPMSTMLEEIMSYMMGMWHSNRIKIMKYEHEICPRIRSKLDKLTKESGKWIPTCADDHLFHVRYNTEKFVVNLNNGTCDCRRWELTGIPCTHAIACMRYFGKPIENYVSEYFKRAAYERCYAHVIKPSNGPQLWPKTATTDVLPPFVPEKTSGKLQKKRRREAEEQSNIKGAKLSQTGKKMTCAVCHKEGHNGKTCMVIPTIPPPPTKIKRTVQPPTAGQQIADESPSHYSEPAAGHQLEPAACQQPEPAAIQQPQPATIQQPQPSACQQTQEVISLNQVSCTQPPQPSQPQPDQREPPELVVSENVGDNIGLFGEEMWEGVEAMMDEFEGSQMRTIDVDACSNHVSVSECGAGRQRNQVDIDSHATGIPAQGSSRTLRKASTGRTKASNVHTSVVLRRSPRFDKKRRAVVKKN